MITMFLFIQLKSRIDHFGCRIGFDAVKDGYVVIMMYEFFHAFTFGCMGTCYDQRMLFLYGIDLIDCM